MSKRRMICTSLFVVLAFVAVTAVTQPQQWDGNGHGYELVPTAMTWSEAFVTASSMNWEGLPGYLATLTSQEEADWVWSWLEAEMGSPCEGAWLGGYQDPPDSETPSSNWRWVTGELWDYTNWCSGEPNDFHGNQEDVLEIWWLCLPYWNDIRQAGRRCFLVEYGEYVVANELSTWGRVKALYDN